MRRKERFEIVGVVEEVREKIEMIGE